MMVIPGQVKGETKLIRRLRGKKQMEKKVCIVYTIQSGKFYRCFLFACGSLLVTLFLFFLFSSFFSMCLPLPTLAENILYVSML